MRLNLNSNNTLDSKWSLDLLGLKINDFMENFERTQSMKKFFSKVKIDIFYFFAWNWYLDDVGQ